MLTFHCYTPSGPSFPRACIELKVLLSSPILLLLLAIIEQFLGPDHKTLQLYLTSQSGPSVRMTSHLFEKIRDGD